MEALKRELKTPTSNTPLVKDNLTAQEQQTAPGGHVPNGHGTHEQLLTAETAGEFACI